MNYKVAIYNGFFNFHFEVFGYLIEYLKYKNYSFTIYCNNNNYSFEWLSYYKDLFKINLNIKSPWLFNSDYYDYIFVINGNKKNFYNNSKIKIISIIHDPYMIDNYPVHDLIITRFLHDLPSYKWALPVFNGVLKNEKKYILDNEIKINILILGSIPDNTIDILKEYIINFDDINFYIISRGIDHIFNKDKYKNIYIYKPENNNFCPTNIVLNLLKKCHYVFCSDNIRNPEYEKNKITGAIPLSFSFGCQLIIPKNWQSYYNFKSIIVYNDKLLLEKYINLDLIYDERDEIINHKNNTIDKIII